MKIALLDQSFHKKTKSLHFFRELLRPLGTISHFFVDEDDLGEIADENDVVILMQTEFCAPYFLSRGKKTVLVPMYDACANMPNSYWSAMAEARVISFCQRLHKRMLENGLNSIYLQYFPDPSTFPVIEDFSDLRGFLWQRRPREGFNWRLVSRLCGSSLATMHVHLAADDGDDGADVLPSDITTSTWGPDYAVKLRAANVFFSPRATEGIGMASLEAMAHGMCVVAHDDATANEYLDHAENGYLYNVMHPEDLALTPAKARQCGLAVRKTVESGYERFNEKTSELLWFISSTPRPSPLYASHFPLSEFIRSARTIFAGAPGMHELLTKAEGRGAFVEALNRFKRGLRRTPVIGPATKELYHWVRGG